MSAPQKAPKADMRWLAQFVARRWFAVLMALACGTVGGIATTLEPYLIGIIIDNLARGVSFSQIGMDIGLLLFFGLVTLVAFFGQRHYGGVIAYETHYDIRKVVFEHLLTREQDFYQRYAVGDLISRMYSDLQFIWRLFGIGFTRFSGAAVGLVATFVLLAQVDVTLTLIVFVVLFVSTGFQMWAGLAITPLMERVQDQQGVLSDLVQDTASGIQTLKSFGREQDAMRHFHHENTQFRQTWLYFRRRYEPVGMLPQLIAQLAGGAVVVFGGIMTINGQMTLGNFAQFLFYLTFITRALLELGTIYQRLMQTRGALERITPLLQATLVASPPRAQSPTPVRGDIRFENVSYEVDGQTLLHEITLHIPSGAVVGIVGATGAGKTLLINLLARLGDVSAGRVCVDGVDVRAWELATLRRAIAYVPQSTFLFSLTLADNIRIGNPTVSDEDLARAVHLSRISNDLAQLPHGLETMVGEKGVMLSGGQKQRVAIARAIACDAPVLVLDDALSSVDTETAADILRDLRSVLRTRTSLMIAHRMASVRDADFIVVLEEGRIVEQGTHDELMAHHGIYAGMVAREQEVDATPARAEEVAHGD